MDKVKIDTELVKRLVASQFPQWKNLPVQPVANGGWDNRTFHLGDKWIVRMPSAAEYASQVEKEYMWLPRLAPLLPLSIPEPIAKGESGEGYAWKWLIYSWIEGEPAATANIADLNDFADSLAHFLIALQHIDTKEGPLPGPHSFYRGGALKTYDDETRKAIAALEGKIDIDTAIDLWESALTTTWEGAPAWVHGDISAGNLLVKEGKLNAVIDFGQLTVGDPACDLAIAWTLFRGESRGVFRKTLQLDDGTWSRGRAWALWKALIVAADFSSPSNAESAQCWRIIDEVLDDYRDNI
jgi:aminoglycoside phosphotransferase (APT) family kinase protein